MSSSAEILDSDKPTETVLSTDGLEDDDTEHHGMVYTWDNINVYNSTPPAGYVTDMITAKQVKGDEPQGCCKGKRKFTHILKNVSGSIRPGELLALMGASGAGKTTLLNVLHFDAGSLHVDGDRCIDGVPMDPAYATEISGYVQQEDLFIPTLTVREHLMFTARLKLDSKLKYSDRVKRVDQVIHELGLTKCQNVKIGDPATTKGISGGEMKRLAFATEYLTDPMILFCDEPTSGLDAFMAQSVVEVMQKMAKRGKSIICTIHQPASEVFEMFDHIYLLSAGRVVYTGTTPETLNFFEETGYSCPLNHNPADFFIFTLAVVPGDEDNCRARTDAICAAYRKTPKYEEVEQLVKYRRAVMQDKRNKRRLKCSLGGTYRVNWFIQLDALMRRTFISTIREPLLFIARLLQMISMGVILGTVFYQQPINQSGTKNINAALFMFILVMTVMNAFGVIYVFCSELPIFLREHWNGMYRTDAYFVAKSIVELPFIVFYSIIFDAIAYYLIGLTNELQRFVWCCIISIMVGNASASFGYLMSTLCKDLVVALAVTPPLLVPIFLFSGFFLREEVTPWFWKWTKFTSWYFYGCETLFINQWEIIEDIGNEKNETLYLGDGEQVLMFFGYEQKRFNFDVICLGVLVLVFRIMAFLCLLLKTYGRK